MIQGNTYYIEFCASDNQFLEVDFFEFDEFKTFAESEEFDFCHQEGVARLGNLGLWERNFFSSKTGLATDEQASTPLCNPTGDHAQGRGHLQNAVV
jgi:hypothetical protein